MRKIKKRKQEENETRQEKFNDGERNRDEKTDRKRVFSCNRKTERNRESKRHAGIG